MTAPLRDVLVKRPGPAFGRAFDDPTHGYLHPVDLGLAQREHDAFVDLLASLGPTVHELGAETESPDLVYQFDPLLVTDRGAIPLRSGKPKRRGEELVVEAWTLARGIPTLARIEAPGTVEHDGEAAAGYLEHVLSTFGTDLAGLRIAVDCANGAFSGLAPAAFERLGAEVTAIGSEPDGANINIGCGATDTAALQAVVTAGAYDLGVAFDGDGDRMLAVDERGDCRHLEKGADHAPVNGRESLVADERIAEPQTSDDLSVFQRRLDAHAAGIGNLRDDLGDVHDSPSLPSPRGVPS